MQNWQENIKLHVSVLVLLSLLIFLGRQQHNGLLNYDDAYYAQKSVEMMSGDNPLLVTHHDQVLYDNPPVHFWITAGFYHLFGVSYYTSVLATGLFAMATVVLTYFFAWQLLGSASLAFISGLILILPGYFHDYARRGMLDQTLVFFFTLALLAAWLARKQAGFFLLFGLSAALAILTKSIIGALSIPVVVFFFLLSQHRRRLLHPYFWAGIAIVATFVGVWMIENYKVAGSVFLTSHFGKLIVARVVEGTHSISLSEYLGYFNLLLKNYWPWLPFTLIGMYLAARSWRRDNNQAAILLLVWTLSILVVMSLTSSKILRYILNIFPALAILSAWGLHTILARRNQVGLGLKVGTVLALLTLLLINSTPITVSSSTGLSENSVEIRALAPYITLNSEPSDRIINFRLGPWDPQNAVYFYSKRLMDPPILEAKQIVLRIEEVPRQLILCRNADYLELVSEFPGSFHRIKAEGEYVLATALVRKNQVRYD